MRIWGFCFLMLLATRLPSQAPEGGMWMPIQLSSLDTMALQEMGLELPLAELSELKGNSIPNAVVSFGGFCSGAFISPEGLLITNHHCAYGAIESHNTRGRNLLENGYWANCREEELPNPGLEVTLLAGMEDVTRQILATIKENGSPEHRQRAIAERCKLLEARYRESTGMDAEIRPVRSGNAWHVYLTRTYRDVRLVGTPPVSIARFGGDQAGRDWPMHTADFTFFRVYADSSNAPADYAPENEPYHPGHSFTISMDRLDKGQFCMVVGYPGESSLNLSYYGMRERQAVYDPAMIRLNETILATLQPEMEKSRQLRSKYGSMYSSSQNSMASLKGELNGLKKLDVAGRRLEEEIKLARWIESTPERHKMYGDLLGEMRILYLRREKLLSIGLHLEAALTWVGLLEFANLWRSLGELSPSKATSRELGLAAAKLSRETRLHFRNHSTATDRKLCEALVTLLYRQLPSSHQASLFPEIAKKHQGDFQDFIAGVYRHSVLSSSSRSLDLLRDFRAKDILRLRRDPGYALMAGIVGYYNAHYHAEWEAMALALWDLQRRYEAALGAMREGKPFAPDANGMLRLSFGRIAEYQPEDGKIYQYATTSAGILEKYRQGDENHTLPTRFLQLLEAGDFGSFGQDGPLMVNFMSTNHTSNGNSGSPVLDGKGWLIGINSARTLESAVSDFVYDPAEVRNVAVDIRYVMYIVTHYARSKYLLSELQDPCLSSGPRQVHCPPR